MKDPKSMKIQRNHLIELDQQKIINNGRFKCAKV